MKLPKQRFKDRPARKASQMRQYVRRLDEVGVAEMLETFPVHQRAFVLGVMRPHLSFEVQTGKFEHVLQPAA